MARQLLRLLHLLVLAGMVPASPASALDEPVYWRDAETGCAYIMFMGSLTPRLRRDGLPDCPGAGRAPSGPAGGSPGAAESLPTQDLVRDLTRTLEALRREVEELRRGFERVNRR